MIKGLLIAFSLYTRLPVKQIDWFDQGRKYVLFSLPIIGCFIGIVWWAASFLFMNKRLIGVALLSLVPYLLCGFIHLDGFLDCCDALLSSASKEKKMLILKDSHVGAFAVLSAILLFLLNFSAMASLQQRYALLLIPIIARIFAIELQFYAPLLEESTMSKHFMEGVSVKIKRLFQLYPILLSGFAFYFFGYPVLILLAYALVHYWLLRSWLLREFDGINGDMCGMMIESLQCGCLIIACFI